LKTAKTQAFKKPINVDPVKHDGKWFDAMYNNRALVPDHADHFARWASQSQKARASQRCTLDVAYGPSDAEKLDVFPAKAIPANKSSGSAVIVFIHGGYWRSLDKADHSFITPGFTQRGACVVVPNYGLCPAVTIPDIALQMTRCLDWVWRNIARYGGDPRRITVVGHSAGGHLAAMLLACDWSKVARDLPRDLVKSAVSISGLYELESVRRVPYLKADLRLTPAQVRKASPAEYPAPARGRITTVVGGDESAEFIRHNGLLKAAWGRARAPVAEVLPGLNHFSILEALTQPSHRLHQLCLTACGLA
jgi:arylformamidase